MVVHGKTNYVIDADIKGFFNNIDHKWVIKFLGDKIADPNIKRLVVKMLKAGIIEGEKKVVTDAGTEQGSIVSPILANIYLHYVLDLWFEKVVKRKCKGYAEMVRFVDDYVCCFQYKWEAENFYRALNMRLNKFGLELAEEKSKIIMFGRFAEVDRIRAGKGKPETFDFLGFTHYCSISTKGKFRLKSKTSKKKFNAKLKAFTNWIKKVKNAYKLNYILKIVKLKLRGHYNYYGITDNSNMIKKFTYEVLRILFKWLNRRSQKRSFSWEKFNLYLNKVKLPVAKIYVDIGVFLDAK